MTDTRVITVGGIDGCGKSTFARRIQAAAADLGLDVLLLHVDDFRAPVAWRRPDRDEAAIYLEDYYDFAALEACVAAFRAGAPRVRRPLYDERRDAAAGYAEVRLAGVAAVVVEGVFTLRLPSAATAFQVHLATSFEEARRRIIARRTPPWRTVEEFEYRIARRYFPAQRRYLAETTPERTADLLVDNEDPCRPGLVRADLGRLPAELRRVLAAVVAPPGARSTGYRDAG